MNPSKEICQFIIKNTGALESGGALETVEKAVFAAVNARMEKHLRTLGGWKGRYELISAAEDETAFAPAAWPEDKDGKYRACYKLTALATDENTYWLSSLLGTNGGRLCIRLWVHGGLGGRGKGEIERKLVTVGTTAAIKDAGVILDEDKSLYLPFAFSGEVLAAEYPTVDKALAPLDTALDKLLKAHPLIDAAVKELAAKR